MTTDATMAENCNAAAARMEQGGNPADAADARALRAVAAIHQANADRAAAPRYWWRDRE